MFLFAEMGLYDQVKSFFDNNVFNWLVLVVLLYVLWQKTMPSFFKTRADSIEETLKEAKSAKQQGEVLLLNNDPKSKMRKEKLKKSWLRPALLPKNCGCK